MSTTRQQWIDKSISIASRGLKPGVTPALAAEMIGEDLLSNVALQVGIDLSKNRDTRNLLMTQSTIAFVNGVGALPANTLTQYAFETNLFDFTNSQTSATRYSYEAQEQEFIKGISKIGRYYINGLVIKILEPNVAFSPTTGLTGNRILYSPMTPFVPVQAADLLLVHDEIVNRLVLQLANALMAMPIPEPAK